MCMCVCTYMCVIQVEADRKGVKKMREKKGHVRKKKEDNNVSIISVSDCVYLFILVCI